MIPALSALSSEMPGRGAGPQGVPILENFSCSILRGELTQSVVKPVVWRLDVSPGSASDWLDTLASHLTSLAWESGGVALDLKSSNCLRSPNHHVPLTRY